MRSNFLELEQKSKKKRLHLEFSISNDRSNSRKSEKVEQKNAKTNVSRTRKKQTLTITFSGFQKNQLTHFMLHLERYTSTLPVFGFNSGRYDTNFVTSYLNPFLVIERKSNLIWKEIEPVIKKANQFWIDKPSR